MSNPTTPHPAFTKLNEKINRLERRSALLDVVNDRLERITNLCDYAKHYPTNYKLNEEVLEIVQDLRRRIKETNK